MEFDVRSALRDAVTEVLRLESAAFTLEHLKGTTALIPGFLEMRRVSGEVDIPNRFRLKVEAETVLPRSFDLEPESVWNCRRGLWRRIYPRRHGTDRAAGIGV